MYVNTQKNTSIDYTYVDNFHYDGDSTNKLIRTNPIKNLSLHRFTSRSVVNMTCKHLPAQKHMSTTTWQYHVDPLFWTIINGYCFVFLDSGFESTYCWCLLYVSPICNFSSISCRVITALYKVSPALRVTTVKNLPNGSLVSKRQCFLIHTAGANCCLGDL